MFELYQNPSPWWGEDDHRVGVGTNVPTHYLYKLGAVRKDGSQRQWLVVGFGPTATFSDGVELKLDPIPEGCSVKGLEPLAVRAPARKIHKVYRA